MSVRVAWHRRGIHSDLLPANKFSAIAMSSSNTLPSNALMLPRDSLEDASEFAGAATPASWRLRTELPPIACVEGPDQRTQHIDGEYWR